MRKVNSVEARWWETLGSPERLPKVLKKFGRRWKSWKFPEVPKRIPGILRDSRKISKCCKRFQNKAILFYSKKKASKSLLVIPRDFLNISKSPKRFQKTISEKRGLTSCASIKLCLIWTASLLKVFQESQEIPKIFSRVQRDFKRRQATEAYLLMGA